jgi:hypothetical protein
MAPLPPHSFLAASIARSIATLSGPPETANTTCESRQHDAGHASRSRFTKPCCPEVAIDTRRPHYAASQRWGRSRRLSRRFTQSSKTLPAVSWAIARRSRSLQAQPRRLAATAEYLLRWNIGRDWLFKWPLGHSTFGTKCAWFSSMIDAVCTSAALHRLFGMSSSQFSTTTELFGLRPLLVAWMAWFAVVWRLIQGFLSLTHGDGRQPFGAAVRPGRWIVNAGGVEPLSALATASWFHITGRRDGPPGSARWQAPSWPAWSTFHCEMSTFVEQAFASGTRRRRCA